METSMSSRAALLLQREQYRLNKGAGTWGVEAHPVKNDIFHWQGMIEGLPDTPWEGGLFKLEMFFDEEYNEKPPEIYFTTIPFHPNGKSFYFRAPFRDMYGLTHSNRAVDMSTGRPCVPFLEDSDDWEPDTPVLGMLGFLQSLLANPMLDKPVNIAAADIYNTSPRLYSQLVRDCVVASRRVHAGLAPFEEMEEQIDLPDEEELKSLLPITFEPDTVEPHTSPRQVIRFDDYYEFWKTVATSLPVTSLKAVGQYLICTTRQTPESTANYSTPDVRLSPELNTSRDGVTAPISEQQLREMLQRHHNLWYGKGFNRKKKKKPIVDPTRDERIEAMRRIYSMQPKSGASDERSQQNELAISLTVSLPSATNYDGRPSGRQEVGKPHSEDWEREADDLLSWTAQLEHSQIERQIT